MKLKPQQREQEKRDRLLEAQICEAVVSTPAVESNGDVRFSARSAKAQRRRTGLSADDYAQLVGVSALTIYNWEHRKSRPRQEQLASLASIRGIGKREAQAKVRLLKAAEEKPRKVSRAKSR